MKEDAKEAPSKATGELIKIFVTLNIGRAAWVEVKNDIDVSTFCDAIDTKFKLGGPADLLVVRSPNAAAEPLTNLEAALADVLVFDAGKYRVYVTVPPKEEVGGKKRHLQPTMEVIPHPAEFVLRELPVAPITRAEDAKVDVALGALKPFCVGVAADPTKHFYYRRHYLDNLVNKLRQTEISVVHAHRQAGKTTFLHQQLNDGRAWTFSLDDVLDEDYAKISTLSRLEESARPSMVIVDEAQSCIEPKAHEFMKKLRGQCQAAKIPLIAVGTFATIALLRSGWDKGMSPITTSSVHQLWPFSIDETKEFFAQAKLECGLSLGQDVVEAIHDMSGGNVGFLGMVGRYLEEQGWCGKPFLITDYYRAFHKDLRTLLLGSRGDALDELVNRHPTLVPYLCYASRLSEKDVGDSLGSLLAAGVLVILGGSTETPSKNLPLVNDTAKYVVASPLYRHYLSSKMAEFLSETRLSHTWPSAKNLHSILSAFDVNSLVAYASSGSLTEYAYQSQFGRAVSQYDPNIELLCEMRWGGRMRADFLLGTNGSKHVIELLMGATESNLVEHAQRALVYKDSLGAKTACLICFCHQAPSSFITFPQVPIFYVWPHDKTFSALVLTSPKL